MNLEDLKKLQSEFLKSLKRLTEKGLADWFRKESDPELVFCSCKNDLFIFELHDGTAENLAPFENPHGITVKLRNFSLIWLEGLDDWELLLSLVKRSQIDNHKLAIVKRLVLEAVVLEMEDS